MYRELLLRLERRLEALEVDLQRRRFRILFRIAHHEAVGHDGLELADAQYAVLEFGLQRAHAPGIGRAGLGEIATECLLPTVRRLEMLRHQ